jgi:glutamine cyclotransferase
MKYLYIFLFVFLISCNGNKQQDKDPDIIPSVSGIPAPANIPVTLLSKFPHDSSAYTQGLVLHEGKMYEGTGDYANSSLRITNYRTGIVEKKHLMGSRQIFGEGITIFKNQIYQLTWQSHIVYVYALNNLDKPVQTFNWPYEGWGITHNGTDLIISDGSANLYFVDPSNFKVKNTVAVRDNLGSVVNLNELEYINGYVYANVYETNNIVKIDPESGHVKGIISLPGLLQQEDVVAGRTDVLNGIAYDSATGNILVTGKRWPKLFELRLQ